MSVASSIRNALVPIHPEGYKFIAIFFAVSIVLGFLWTPLFWVGLLLTAWCALFFRDPPRVTPVHDSFVVSPADGRISHVGKVVPPAELDLGSEPMLRVSIFMNVFNCHINRAPVSGGIASIVYRKGAFLNAELDKASSENERNSLVIDSANGKVAVVQIAGLVARRILCFAQKGERLSAGERFGLIRFGSRLDVYMPEPARALVSPGQTSIGGETVIARFDEDITVPLVRTS